MPEALATFTHRGVNITLDRNGQFCATVGATNIRRASLSAVRREINTRGNFPPFKALWVNPISGAVLEVTVVARLPDVDYIGAPYWQTSTGARRTSLYPLSARRALDRHQKLCKRAKAARKAADDFLKGVPTLKDAPGQDAGR